MAKRFGFAGDLHKRAKDITTIEGYVNCTLAVQKSLMETIKELELDAFGSLGDWYDKGYVADVAASLSDYDLDIEMSRQLNGQFYGLIGNHIRLNMDSNPELHLIQPHPYYKSRKPITRKDQIIKTPEYLRVYDVQISFMHYVMGIDDVLGYKPKRQPWAKYHIALFHTPLIVPNAQLMNTRYGFNTSSNSKIGKVLTDVDLAICGDIHHPIGKFTVNTETGTTTMIVPGSLTNTDSSELGRHSSIAMPIVTINDDSTVSLEFHPFDLHTNLVTFTKKNVEQSYEKIKTLRGKALVDLYEPTEVAAAIGSHEESLLSLNAYMRQKGYTDKDRALVRSVLDAPESIDRLINIYLDKQI